MSAGARVGLPLALALLSFAAVHGTPAAPVRQAGASRPGAAETPTAAVFVAGKDRALARIRTHGGRDDGSDSRNPAGLFPLMIQSGRGAFFGAADPGESGDGVLAYWAWRDPDGWFTIPTPGASTVDGGAMANGFKAVVALAGGLTLAESFPARATRVGAAPETWEIRTPVPPSQLRLLVAPAGRSARTAAFWVDMGTVMVLVALAAFGLRRLAGPGADGAPKGV